MHEVGAGNKGYGRQQGGRQQVDSFYETSSGFWKMLMKK